MKRVIELNIVGARCVPATTTKEADAVLLSQGIDCLVLDDYFEDTQSRSGVSPQADALMVAHQHDGIPTVIVSFRKPTRSMVQLNDITPFFRVWKPKKLRVTDDNKEHLETFDRTLVGVVTKALYCKKLLAKAREPNEVSNWRFLVKRILFWLSGVAVGAVAGNWILKLIAGLVS